MTKKPKPIKCPVCGGRLHRWRQRVQIIRGGWNPKHVTLNRWYRVCRACKVRVILHAHRG